MNHDDVQLSPPDVTRPAAQHEDFASEAHVLTALQLEYLEPEHDEGAAQNIAEANLK